MRAADYRSIFTAAWGTVRPWSQLQLYFGLYNQSTVLVREQLHRDLRERFHRDWQREQDAAWIEAGGR